MRFGRCPAPVWNGDDISLCFQHDYLQSVFPILLCAISFLVIASTLASNLFARRKGTGHVRLSATEHDVYEADPELDEALNGSAIVGQDAAKREALRKALMQEPEVTIDVNHPKGATLYYVGEVICAAVLLALQVAEYGSDAYSHRYRGKLAEICAIAVWAYILLLLLLRHVVSRLKTNPLPTLWNHTATLYGFQWLWATVMFRSAVIGSPPQIPGPASSLRISRFAFATALFLLALVQRRGNATVVRVSHDGLPYTREPLASVLSAISYGWVDSIVWQGYKKPFQIGDIWDMMPYDQAAYLVEDFRKIKSSGGLAWRLARYFSWDLAVQMLWATVAALVGFVPTVLLRKILEYMEQSSDVSRSTAWLYVILLAVAGLVSAVTDGMGLWIGRKMCIRSRAILTGEIYAKTLRRRAAAAGAEDAGLSESKKPAARGDAGRKEKGGIRDKVSTLFKKKDKIPDLSSPSGTPDAPPSAKDGEKKDTQVNTGAIINLMSTDTFQVGELTSYLHFLFPTVPIQLVIAILLLYQVLGWSALISFVVMALLVPVNLGFAYLFTKSYKMIMKAADARIHTTNEVLQNIKIIKYFAWEQRFFSNVNEKRKEEVASLRYRFQVWASAVGVWDTVPLLITGLSFLIYTVVEKKPLYPSIAFTAISLFNLLRQPLDRFAGMTSQVQQSLAAISRIEKYLNEEDTQKYEQLSGPGSSSVADGTIGFSRATCSWGSVNEDPSVRSPAFRMIDLDVKFHVGKLNIVAGPTGSGKTSLLMALLGEMTLIKGSVHLPVSNREDLVPDPETGLVDGVAYCAQQAWLVNDTIKENILFASPYDEEKYNMVVEACALSADFAVLSEGDNTLVGDKGIVVSGGQKQRISLARALYCDAKHILLDDCLSAVDSHTAKHIFEGLVGPLTANRTIILVTHNIGLTVSRADFVVVLNNGKIAARGPPDRVIASGALGDELQKSRPGSSAGTGTNTPVSGETQGSSTGPLDQSNGDANGKVNGAAQDKSHKKVREDVKDANIRTEEKAVGAVDRQAILLYVRAMGPWFYWFLILVGFVAENLALVATNWWIREWSNSYQAEEVRGLGFDRGASRYERVQIYPAVREPVSVWIVPSWQHASPAFHAASRTMTFGYDVDPLYFLGIYAVLGLLHVAIAVAKFGVIFGGSLNASRTIHSRLMEAVLRAQFKFFDTTPIGQIMNRFSKDLQAVDQNLATIAAAVFASICGLLATIILISVITPGFLIAALFLSVIYAAVGYFYVQSSRDLKRLETSQRSPIFQQFGETIAGVTTIRAYGDIPRFTRDNQKRINTHNRPFIYLWGANRWLAFRVDAAGSFVAFFAAAFIVANVDSIDAGAAGLSLSYALNFNDNILWLVRLYADSEQNMTHVERIKQFLDIEQEAPAILPEARPPGDWPSKGKVEFIDYSTRYRPDLPHVLSQLSFKIDPEEKVGIVGRTGAGKSSTALALFRGLEADTGKILIDGIDIGHIGLQDLRENITIVPQDPTLFTGTIRTNLDPFGLYTDEEIFAALRRVHLVGDTGTNTPDLPTITTSSDDVDSRPVLPALEPQPSDGADLARVTTNTKDENANVFLNLSSTIAESGSNLSQGQRQLLCLARAMLKAPRVLMMDEATASIDYATDAKIQKTLRELTGSTIITIAHRLNTIIDYDKILVLDKGRLVEYDAPWVLLGDEKSIFRAMCEKSGDMEALREGARKAERSRMLVDVDDEE